MINSMDMIPVEKIGPPVNNEEKFLERAMDLILVQAFKQGNGLLS